MSHEERRTTSEGRGDNVSAARGVIDRLRASLGRVRRYAGPERETLLIIVKSTIAASLAWYLAERVFQSQFPAFAPFAAVLMLQVTVYQSLIQSTRFVLAIVLGVALQGLLGLALGPTVVTFVIVTLMALTIGRWRRLGSQGSQVVTAAFFAYTAFLTGTGTFDRLSLLASLIGLVLVGCAIGILVNLIIVPPMRYRSADYAVENLAKSVHDLIMDISEAVRQGPPPSGDSDHWRYRAERLEKLAERTHDTIDRAAESVRYNPRRLLLKTDPPFGGYRTVVERLGRVSYQLSSIAETLSRTRDDPKLPHEGFLEHYGAFLGHVGDAAQQLEELLDATTIADEMERLSEYVDRARDEQPALTNTSTEDPITPAEQARVYGGLLIDADRLVGEFTYIHTTLANTIERSGSKPDSRSDG